MKWEIDQPDFRASAWMPAKLKSGELMSYRECQELIAGRWEGFVSIKKDGYRANRRMG